MTGIARKLAARLTAGRQKQREVENLVTEIIELADHDALDIVRSRQGEQEVVGIIDRR